MNNCLLCMLGPVLVIADMCWSFLGCWICKLLSCCIFAVLQQKYGVMCYSCCEPRPDYPSFGAVFFRCLFCTARVMSCGNSLVLECGPAHARL
jgi:hypothetical protein